MKQKNKKTEVYLEEKLHDGIEKLFANYHKARLVSMVKSGKKFSTRQPSVKSKNRKV